MRILIVVVAFLGLGFSAHADSNDIMENICDEYPGGMHGGVYYTDGPFNLKMSSVEKDKIDKRKLWITFSGDLIDCTAICYKVQQHAKEVSIHIIARIVGTEGPPCGQWDTSSVVQRKLFLISPQELESVTIKSDINYSIWHLREEEYYAETVEHKYRF